MIKLVTTRKNDAQWKPRLVGADPAEGEMGVDTTWQQVVKAPLGSTETVDGSISYIRDATVSSSHKKPPTPDEVATHQ